MKKVSHSGFTLVEMMIVIAILMLVFTFVYLPYTHFQEKVKIRQATREAAQAINEARNLAINWVQNEQANDDTNRSVWVFFSKEDWKKDKIYFISAPFNDIDAWDNREAANMYSKVVSAINWWHPEVKLIGKPRSMPEWTQFDGVAWSWNDILFYYEAVSGTGTFASAQSNPINDSRFQLDFSYKWSDSDVLKKRVHYDTRTYLTDYGSNLPSLTN